MNVCHAQGSPIIGLVVEGESEIGAIQQLLKDTGLRFSGPIKFGGQPENCSQDTFQEFIKREVVPCVRAMVLKKISAVVVVIDREDREACPGEFAQAIHQIITSTMVTQYKYIGSPPVSVVCADRQLENWLIADPKGISGHNFITKNPSKTVGNNADGKDAISLIKSAYPVGHHYHKRMDAPKLASKVRALHPDVRSRSHSLDKLLRECGV